MTGTLTRSKAEIFLHRTRTGTARPDPKRHVSTLPKDLRLKRIFTGKTETISPIADLTDGIDSPEKKAMFEEGARSENGSISANKLGSVGDTLDSSGPTEALKSGSTSMNEVGSWGNSGVLNGRTEVDQSSNGNKTRLGLFRCSRSKLIANTSYTSSYSYRRLLPYLNDLAKEDSSSVITDDPFQAEKLAEAKQSFSHADPLSNQQNPTVLLNKQDPSVPLDSSSREDQELEGNPKLNSDVELPRTTIASSPEMHNKRKLVLDQVASNKTASDSEMVDDKKIEKEATEHLNPQEDISQASIVESPSSYKKRKLQVQLATCKTSTNDCEMEDTHRLEEVTSEKIDGCNTGLLIGSDDASIQSTPPDAYLINKLDTSEGGGRSNILEPESRITRLTPASSSRMKLFPNPNSFSYRRLLPYIMDQAENGSSKSLSPASVAQNQTITSGDSPATASIFEHQIEENPDSQSHSSTSQEDILSPVITVPLSALDSKELKIKKCKSDIPLRSSFDEYEMVCKSSSCSFPIPEDLSFAELSGNVEGCLHSPLQAKPKPLGEVSKFESSSSRGSQSHAPKKGILKKQARGCRGICTCLDCASFRLNAERGFEFSRKQMLEADEVAEQLMKELSCLRNLVERVVMPGADNGTSSNPQLNQQIRGVCQRTLTVETTAKRRMREMIRDLNAHCRIPGPRVSFSEHIEKSNIL